jgi:2'-5' RNA ligase
MRCFVAVDLEPGLKKEIVELQKQLTGLDTKLIEPENMHFTLKFLGEVDVKGVNEVSELLGRVAAEFGPFNVAIENAGVFPNEKFIRVVWLGGAALLNLQMAVEEELSALFKREKPVPHLTLCRVHSQKYHKELIDFVRKNEKIKIGAMRVDAIRLKESILSRGGPVYKDIKVFELGA